MKLPSLGTPSRRTILLMVLAGGIVLSVASTVIYYINFGHLWLQVLGSLISAPALASYLGVALSAFAVAMYQRD